MKHGRLGLIGLETVGQAHAKIFSPDKIPHNFASSILHGKPLIAPAADGIRSVELASTILLSIWTGEPVDLPLNAAL